MRRKALHHIDVDVGGETIEIEHLDGDTAAWFDVKPKLKALKKTYFHHASAIDALYSVLNRDDLTCVASGFDLYERDFVEYFGKRAEFYRAQDRITAIQDQIDGLVGGFAMAPEQVREASAALRYTAQMMIDLADKMGV